MVAPQHLELSGGAAFGTGLGLTAYVLGLRHAVDPDHIAAIDGTTRKLLADGQRPLGVGFFFSLGHATVVFVLGLLVCAGVRGLGGAVRDEGSALHQATAVVGPLISGTFLVVIDLAILLGIVRQLRALRTGDERPGPELHPSGLMTRGLARVSARVGRSWHMLPLGFLFGLGFDTATEVALLLLAGGAAAGGLPWVAVLCLPVLFAAGMTLVDTVNGAAMSLAYGWALERPVRKLRVNLVLTGLSVALALAIGTSELLGVLTDQFGSGLGPG